jgi:hypothetical protein
MGRPVRPAAAQYQADARVGGRGALSQRGQGRAAIDNPVAQECNQGGIAGTATHVVLPVRDGRAHHRFPDRQRRRADSSLDQEGVKTHRSTNPGR